MTKHEHELTRKEMKGPDQFQVAFGRAATWVASNEKHVAWIAAGLVALVAAGVGVNAWRGSREQQAAGLLYKALEDMEGVISSVPVPALSTPTFKTVEEKQRAVLAASEEVRRQYPSSEAARTATLAAGEAHFKLGEHDLAIASWEDYLRSAKDGDSLRFAALDGIARAQEAKGALDQSAATFERLASEAVFYRDRATLERARVLAKAGKGDEAKKILQAFPTDFKDSQLRPEAQELLARLGGA
jgi:predicted negative regulator of RcsB-dependent stress response